MVRTITLIPVASDQLHSHWRYCDGPDFDSFAVIMSKFLRSRSLAVSEKNIDKFWSEEAEGGIRDPRVWSFAQNYKTSEFCMTWSHAAGPRVWVIPEWPHLWHSLSAEPRLMRLCHKIAFLLGASRETRPNVMSGNSTIKTNGFQTVSI